MLVALAPRGERRERDADLRRLTDDGGDMAEAGALAPRSLFVSQREHRLIKQALPPAQGDTIQLLVESDSALAEALRDPQSEVFLR